MTAIELVQGLLLAAGAGFFAVGTLGLLRFPDVYSRVHALTKADNLGLGLIVFGLLPSAASPATAVKLLLVWGIALVASATAGYLVARAAHRRGVAPWTGTPDPQGSVDPKNRGRRANAAHGLWAASVPDRLARSHPSGEARRDGARPDTDPAPASAKRRFDPDTEGER